MILICDYVSYKQPEIAKALMYGKEPEDYIAAAEMPDHLKWLDRLMRQRPRRCD